MLALRTAVIERTALLGAVRQYTAPQQRLGLSKKRQAMQKKQYCMPGPSVPISIMIMLFATFNIFATRQAYLFLTTSERDVRNRRDFVMSDQRALRHERDRVQRTNDLFHEAGHRGKLLSFEALTLQFPEVAWSFLILPSALVTGILLFIFFSGRQERQERLQQNQEVYSRRLDDAASKREALVAELEAARQLLKEEQARRTRDDAALDAEIVRLTGQLDELSTLQTITSALSSSPPSSPHVHSPPQDRHGS